MSVGTAQEEIQVAIRAKLIGDATLMSLVTGVFDFGAVPINQPFPYIAIGDTTEGAMDAFGTDGYDDTCTVHIWDSSPGFNTCKLILARMNVLLNKKPLTLVTQHHVGTWYQFSATMNDPGSDDIRHMPVRYSIQTQEQ